MARIPDAFIDDRAKSARAHVALQRAAARRLNRARSARVHGALQRAAARRLNPLEDGLEGV